MGVFVPVTPVWYVIILGVIAACTLFLQRNEEGTGTLHVITNAMSAA